MNRWPVLAVACLWWLVLLITTWPTPRYWLPALAFILIGGLVYTLSALRVVEAVAHWIGEARTWRQRAERLDEAFNDRANLRAEERAVLIAQRDAIQEEADALRKERDYYKPKFQRCQDDLARCAGENERLRAENAALRQQIEGR